MSACCMAHRLEELGWSRGQSIACQAEPSETAMREPKPLQGGCIDAQIHRMFEVLQLKVVAGLRFRVWGGVLNP